jgi:hypothetical protein
VRRAWTVVLAGAIATFAPAAAAASDASIKRSFVEGLAQVRAPSTPGRLDAELRRTLHRLRADTPSSAAGRRGRSLAVQGFVWLRRRVQAQLAMTRNDSGNVEAAIRDAVRADRCLARAAVLLRSAGRALEVRVGKIDGR